MEAWAGVTLTAGHALQAAHRAAAWSGTQSNLSLGTGDISTTTSGAHTVISVHSGVGVVGGLVSDISNGVVGGGGSIIVVGSHNSGGVDGSGGIIGGNSGGGGNGGGISSTSGDIVGLGGLQEYYEQLLAHPNIRMRDELLRYVTPILVLFGNVSNLLALAVLRRKNLRTSSVCFYMSAYALANLVVLDCIMLMIWLCYMLEKPYIGALSDWGCRLWTFVSNVISYCGIWFVVVLSMDRFIYLCYAHKAKTYCKVFTAKAMTLVVVIMLIVVSIHAMWTYELQPQGCFVSFEDDLHIKTWPLWSATIYSYMPLTLLLFVNITLSVSLCLKRHRQRRATTVNGIGDDFAVTTLVLSSAFFLLTVPATITNVVDIYLPMNLLSLQLISEIELAKKITEILSLGNQTLLGVILFVFSRAFRFELYALLHSCRIKRRPKVYEMGCISGASASGAEREDGGGGGGTAGGGAGGGGDTTTTTTTTASAATSAVAASHNGTGGSNGRVSGASGTSTHSRDHIEYEVCNSSDLATEISTV